MMSLAQSLWYTERGWLVAENPYLLLTILTRQGVKSGRKYRLAACACCHEARGRLKGHQRAVLEQSERYADGLVSREELQRAVNRCSVYNTPRWTAQWAARQTGHRQGRSALHEVLESLLRVMWSFPEASGASPREASARRYAGIIRDVFGNPFRPASLKEYRTRDVQALAGAIYEEKDWKRMPILADALEDAGCAEEGVLEHCRAGGGHVRGCWVVDAVLGKE